MPSVTESTLACLLVTAGIDAQNIESIFEEHTIRSTLDPTMPGSNEYGLRERTFNFGAVIAQVCYSRDLRRCVEWILVSVVLEARMARAVALRKPHHLVHYVIAESPGDE